MADVLRVSTVCMCPATSQELATGLLGWVTIQVGALLLLDGIALRRTRGGRLALSFPERSDSHGRRHPIVRPLDDRARHELESQVFASLGLREGEAR